MTDGETDAARRDRIAAENAELRQQVAEMKATQGKLVAQSVKLIHDVATLRSVLHDLYDLVDADATFENRDIEPYKYDAIVADVTRRARDALARKPL